MSEMFQSIDCFLDINYNFDARSFAMFRMA